jgi:hypothetical protein
MKWLRAINSIQELEEKLISSFLFLSLAVLSLVQVLFIRENPWYFQSMLLLAMGIIFWGIKSKKTQRKRLFSVLIILIYSIISVAKFSLLETTHSAPLMNFYELGMTGFLILIYGISKVWWVPVITLSANYLRIYLLDYAHWGDHWVALNNTHFSYFMEVNLFVFSFLALITTVINYIYLTGNKLSKKTEELEKTLLEIDQQNKGILHLQSQHQELSSSNSHNLRNPITRIKSVTQMMQSEEMTQEMSDTYKNEFFRMTVSTSLNELKNALNDVRNEYEAIQKGG